MSGWFGPLEYLVGGQCKPETIESLREELKEAKREIEKLKRALGGNHPLGYRRNVFGG